MIGVSRDPMPAQEAFATKHGFIYPLVSDPDATVCSAFGVEEGVSKDGVKYAKRTTVIIGKDGRIHRIFEGVKVEGHVKAVLESLP